VLLCASLWVGVLALNNDAVAQSQSQSQSLSPSPSLSLSKSPSQSIEAKRYLSTQGIEIVQNRDARAVSVDNKATGAAPDGKPLSQAAKPTQSAVGSSEVAGKAGVVSTSDQSLRDQDRLVILRQELNTELAQFQAKTTALQTPGLKEKISVEEQQRLRYLLGLHEQNIKALTAEINRASNGR
jgi:hypothetical protein